MEHIIQFAIGIDDEAIQKRVMESAEKKIIDDIEQQVRDKIFSSGYYSGHATEKDPLSSFSACIIEHWLDKNKDKLLEKAAIHLADKLSRTKAAKALLEDIKGD